MSPKRQDDNHVIQWSHQSHVQRPAPIMRQTAMFSLECFTRSCESGLGSGDPVDDSQNISTVMHFLLLRRFDYFTQSWHPQLHRGHGAHPGLWRGTRTHEKKTDIRINMPNHHGLMPRSITPAAHWNQHGDYLVRLMVECPVQNRRLCETLAGVLCRGCE